MQKTFSVLICFFAVTGLAASVEVKLLHRFNSKLIEGRTVTLGCVNNTINETSTVWYKNDAVIDNQKTRNLTFLTLKSSDRGLYKCRINGTNSTNNFTVAVKDAFSVPIITLNDSVLNSGEPLQINCSAVVLDNTTSFLYRIRVNRTTIVNETKSFVHTIPSVKSTEAGNYTCEVSLADATDIVKVSRGKILSVTVIVKLTPDHPVAEGKESTFTCTAPGHENITSYQWKLNDTTVLLENARHYNFTPNRTQNGMELSCTATTEGGVTSNKSKIILQVFYLDTPNITLAPANNTIREGRALTFTCIATSSESVTYNWLLPNKTNVVSNILQIGSINRSDAGNYNCTASSTANNITLTASTTTNIAVFYKPGPLKLEVDNQEIHKIVQKKRGDILTIFCRGNDLGKPEGTLQWFKGDSVMALDNVTPLGSTLLSLDFNSSLTRESNGTYTCRIANEVEIEEKSFQLVVLEEPGQPRNLTNGTVTDTSVSLKWTAPAFNGNSPITNYIVSYKTEDDVSPVINTTKNTFIDLNDLKPAQKYEINVTANNSHFMGSPSKITVMTADATPEAPRFFNVSANISQQLSLSWKVPNVTNGQIRLYQYCYIKSSGGEQKCHNTTNNSTKSVNIETLDKYTAYNLSVRGLTSAGFGHPAEANNVFTREEMPYPVNATASAGGARNIKVNWTKPLNIFGVLKDYEVLIKPNGSTNYSSVCTIYPPRPLECLITENHPKFTLTPNTFYFITVIVSNTLFKTGFNTSTKTFKAAPPIPPSPSPPPSYAIAQETFQVQLVSFSQENGPIIHHDIIVARLSGKVLPSRTPQSYSSDEILNGIDNLYVAVRRSGAPKSDDRVTIGNGENTKRKRRDLADPNNKALEPNTHYTVFIRAYVTNDLYTSTDWYPVVITLREDDKMSAGLIAGIVIIIILALIIIGLLMYWLFWRRRQNRDGDTEFHTKNSKKRPISPKELDFLVPVAPNNFENHAQQLHANGNYGFNQEYLSINRELRLPYSQSRMQENNAKNRYHNVPAYDHSRVWLMSIDGEPHSDYINANYIQGYSDAKEYIATQGPLPETVFDFWRMIWETESSTIVMLTKLEEKGRVKCAQYWPENSSLSIKDIVITPTEIHDFPDHTVRSFHVTRMGQAVERVVKQFHFTSWPDFGVPQDPSALLSFMRKVNNWKGLSQCPTIIHCSAGVGRTGTYITIDTQIKRLKSKQDIEVYSNVSTMREQRCLMVQTEDQYVFIHDAIVDYLESGETEVDVNELRDYIKKQSQVDAKTG